MTSQRPFAVIIGSGFGGLGMALEFLRHGFDNFVVLEKATELGGVWRENTYPGAGCDVPSQYYSFSYEPNREWPMRFSLQADILAYMRRVADKYGLDRYLRYGVEVTGADYDDGTGRWQIRTATGDVITADVLIPAMGQLSRPSWPSIPGRDTFCGPAFHSARWDHDVPLAGKRIAVIGTGASAIQFVPRIQPEAAELILFQRTPPHIVPKADTEYRAVHHRLFRRLPLLQAAERAFWWLFCELCTLAIIGNKVMGFLVTQLAHFQLRRQVSDPVLRAKLTPDYPVGCKRVLFANNYYPALAEANVRLETTSISEITTTGVRTADGVEHPADVLIYGTGFAVTDFLAPLTITGRGGRPLDEAWAAGARAYLGIAVPGFPNLFLMYGPNTNLGSGSIIFMLEKQARYIRQLVERLERDGGGSLDVRADVEERYDAEIQRRLAGTVWNSCASWYQDANGRVAANWPGLVTEYDRRTRRPDPADYESVPTPG